MDVRNAILNTADLIERHPEKYNFESGLVPSSIGQLAPACTLAWIGHFLGMQGATYHDVPDRMYGWKTKTSTKDVYEKIGKSARGDWLVWAFREDGIKALASALRAYADREFPA